MPSMKGKYKDMEKYSAYLYRNRKKNYERGRAGAKRHSWSKEEIDLIMNKNGLTDRQISQIIKHSVLAIQVKRHKIKNGG